MSTRENATLLFYPRHNPSSRLLALWYFAGLLIVWNILGHTVLGFEQAWIHPLIGVGSALFFQVVLDWVNARSHHRAPRFLAGWHAWADFSPPAVITGLACTMLLYPNERVWPFIFATAVSIGSKVLFRAPVSNGRTQHFYNPSNLGVALTLLLFPWVGFAPPYHFTRNLTGEWNWIVPFIILLSGIVIHSRFTGRLPLCLAWIGGFVIQGLFRSWLYGNPWYVPLVPMTSAAFIVFTLYMVPDPATTPLNPRRQLLFGLAVAFVYGALQILHVVFGLFIALVLVCTLRGIGLYLHAVISIWPRPTAVTSAPAELAAD
jgi:enediyne biosynthesis protein E5